MAKNKWTPWQVGKLEYARARGEYWVTYRDGGVTRLYWDGEDWMAGCIIMSELVIAYMPDKKPKPYKEN